jgi:hypothetical protein
MDEKAVTMDEYEAFRESARYGGESFRYPDDEPAGPPPVSSKEVARLTMEFVADIMLWSRTAKVARLRLDCARYLMTGFPLQWQIARRHKVTERRVRQAIQEVKTRVGWDIWK